ncbi:ficolin-1-A-like [Mercenaria mercenaria]|uniref:ficolin-1-A-like n=1 Tax=Mercenaria mercenaria TaxID=6596 RepID=UPI00234E7BA9|nr:ficolin-1-A-like [Mercenaria mercenaria]
MTATRLSELRIDLTAADGNQSYELFQNFRLGIAPSYTLHIEHGTGTAGDSHGLSNSNNNDFATFDEDNVNRCAVRYHGGWWYGSCAFANLNGEYGTPGHISSYSNGEGGFTYREFQLLRMLRESFMMFRRV